MLAELRTKSQITIPKEIVTKLGLAEGDKLDISEENGMIYIMPVTVYPKNYVAALRSEVEQVKKNIQSGKQPTFQSIDALFDKLEGN